MDVSGWDGFSGRPTKGQWCQTVCRAVRLGRNHRPHFKMTGLEELANDEIARLFSFQVAGLTSRHTHPRNMVYGIRDSGLTVELFVRKQNTAEKRHFMKNCVVHISMTQWLSV